MRRLPTKPCEKCGQPTPGRIRRVRRWWKFPRKWHWFCVTCAPAVVANVMDDEELPLHMWQEYNAFGNTCHYPGCTLTIEEHPQVVK